MKKGKIEINVGGLKDLKDVVEEIISDIQSESHINEKKIAIGRISEKLRLEYLDWNYKKVDLQDEIKFKKEQFAKRMERELTELFEDRYNQLEQAKGELWEKIESELGISDQNHNLNINVKTGTISRYVNSENKKENTILN